MCLQQHQHRNKKKKNLMGDRLIVSTRCCRKLFKSAAAAAGALENPVCKSQTIKTITRNLFSLQLSAKISFL